MKFMCIESLKHSNLVKFNEVNQIINQILEC